jgi:hypothetical protein
MSDHAAKRIAGDRGSRLRRPELRSIFVIFTRAYILPEWCAGSMAQLKKERIASCTMPFYALPRPIESSITFGRLTGKEPRGPEMAIGGWSLRSTLDDMSSAGEIVQLQQLAVRAKMRFVIPNHHETQLRGNHLCGRVQDAEEGRPTSKHE